MLIPSIDLMGGKIVQLIQGEKKALEFDDFEYWTQQFSRYPLVQLIDLDAALGHGQNRELVKRFIARLRCQVGGGIRSAETARWLFKAGARRVIIGSALFRQGKIQVEVARSLAREFGAKSLVFAVDARKGRIAINGWRTLTAITPADAMRKLQPYCGAFLYTHIDTEGLMCGIPFDTINELQSLTGGNLICAGGISTQKEIDRLDAIGVDAVVGMAVYLKKICCLSVTR